MKTGKTAGMMAASITAIDRNAAPMKAATKMISIVSPWFNFSIMLELLRAAITARPVTAIS